jgi:hypothetical protein
MRMHGWVLRITEAKASFQCTMVRQAGRRKGTGTGTGTGVGLGAGAREGAGVGIGAISRTRSNRIAVEPI